MCVVFCLVGCCCCCCCCCFGLLGGFFVCFFVVVFVFVFCLFVFFLLVGCLTFQQHASVSQGRIYSDNCTRCHTEIKVAGPTFHLTQSQYTDTGPTSPSAALPMPGAWQGIHWSASYEVIGMKGVEANMYRNNRFLFVFSHSFFNDLLQSMCWII